MDRARRRARPLPRPGAPADAAARARARARHRRGGVGLRPAALRAAARGARRSSSGPRADRFGRRIDAARALGFALFTRPAPARLRWPVEQAGLSSLFGMRLHPVEGRRRMHQGVDLAAAAGRVVSAAAKGWVVRAGWTGGYGLMVEVRHPGELTTRYSHLSALLCAPGRRGRRGPPARPRRQDRARHRTAPPLRGLARRRGDGPAALARRVGQRRELRAGPEMKWRPGAERGAPIPNPPPRRMHGCGGRDPIRLSIRDRAVNGAALTRSDT